MTQEPENLVVWAPQPGPQQALIECPLPLIGYGGARGGGKGLLRTQKVQTPHGLKAIGDLRLGDVLCAIDGGTTKVVGIYERGVQPCYRITFSDGKEVVCDADHRWRLRFPGTAQARLEKYGPQLRTGRRIAPGIWTTEKLAQRVTKAKHRPQLPLIDPIALEPIYSSLPIEPYTLGLLLGDGCISNRGTKRHFSFGTADEELRDFFIGAGWNCRKASSGPLSKRAFWDLRAYGQVATDLANELTALGLQGADSYTKFIPEAYFMASVKDRFAILQGLMDTDGSISLCGSAQFDSVSKRLIDGVRALVESLGGYCSLKTYKQKVRAKSAGKNLQPFIYRLAIRLGDNSGLFRLRRKLIRCRRVAKQAVRCIVKIEEVEPQETVCIKVDHHTSMFLLEGCIPTMNTDGVLGKFGILAETLGEAFNGVFFRKELPQADDLIERAKQIYLPLEAHYNDQKKQFTFKGGGRLRFRPLANNADAEKYQGQNLSHAAVEEAGNYPTPEPIFKLFGALRGGENPQIILTFNPGGSGHHWLKERFIKPAPKGWQILQWEIGNGKKIDYIYIPSRVHDNKILLDKDPGYIDRLHMVGSPELVRAWLEGDFEIHEGSYFPEFSSKHILTPFNVPKHWPKYLGFDWGYRSPFAAVWGAISSGKTDDGREMEIPKGAIVIYREMWGRQIENKEQAERIASVSVGENVHAVADPSIFTSQGGPSINDQFNLVFSKFKHPAFRAADNDRISGWSQIRRRLQASPPMLYFFSTCPYLIESVPALQLDPKNHEDADSTGDDHACDALRYLCKERLLESAYERPVEKSVHRGRVKLQLYINQVRSEQKRARL